VTYTIERRVEIFMALCEAVSFAHSRGIIHRDIKPANIMVGAYGEVVLMDWGVAKVRGSEPEPSRPSPGVASPAAHTVPSDALSTVAGALVGTPFYMSPEQAKGLPADERSDVYSLCHVFYELLALQHPLEKKVSLAEVLQGAAVEPVPTLHSIRHRLRASTRGAQSFSTPRLEKDPALRYPTVTAMIERLRARAMGDIPVECSGHVHQGPRRVGITSVDRTQRGR
jgi:serine/threonine-protein kinase